MRLGSRWSVPLLFVSGSLLSCSVLANFDGLTSSPVDAAPSSDGGGEANPASDAPSDQSTDVEAYPRNPTVLSSAGRCGHSLALFGETLAYSCESDRTVRVVETDGRNERLLTARTLPLGDVAVRDQYVYYMYTASNSRSVVDRLDLLSDAGPPLDPYFAPCSGSDQFGRRLAAHGSQWFVTGYCTPFGYSLFEIRTDGSGGQSLAQNLDVYIRAIAVTAQWVFYTTLNEIRAFDRGTRQHVAFAQDPNALELGATETELYWTTTLGTVRRAALDGGIGPVTLASGLASPGRFAIAGTELYVATEDGVTAIGMDGVEKPFVRSEERVRDVVANDAFVFFLTVGGKVFRAPR